MALEDFCKLLTTFSVFQTNFGLFDTKVSQEKIALFGGRHHLDSLLQHSPTNARSLTQEAHGFRTTESAVVPCRFQKKVFGYNY